MPGVYNRNQNVIPSQSNDPFELTYLQQADILPVDYGSSAGGKAVRNSIAMASPGYSQSNFDRPVAGADGKGFGNTDLAYQDGLEQVNGQTSQYYQAVRELNDLSAHAEKLGFNIKRPDFRDDLQVRLYQQYQDGLGRATASAEQLKQGRENFKLAAPKILDGTLMANRHGGAFNGGAVTTQADVQGLKQTTSAETKAYNDALRNTDNANEFKDAKAYEDRMRNQLGAIIVNPNATAYEKEHARAQLRQLDVTTYDNNHALDREQRERFHKDEQNNDLDIDNNERLLRAVAQLDRGNFDMSSDGELQNRTFAGANFNAGNQKGKIDYISKDPKTGEMIVHATTYMATSSKGNTFMDPKPITFKVGDLKQFALMIKGENKDAYGGKGFNEVLKGHETANNEIDFNGLFPETKIDEATKTQLNGMANPDFFNSNSASSADMIEQLRKAGPEKAEIYQRTKDQVFRDKMPNGQMAPAVRPSLSKEDLRKRAAAAGYSYEEYYKLVKDKIDLKK